MAIPPVLFLAGLTAIVRCLTLTTHEFGPTCATVVTLFDVRVGTFFYHDDRGDILNLVLRKPNREPRAESGKLQDARALMH